MKQFEVVYRQEDVLSKNVNLKDLLDSHKQISKYAYILHNDEGIVPHYHIYLRCEKHQVTVNDVAKWLDIDSGFVHIVKSHLSNVLKYFLQELPTQKRKYSVNELITNINPFPI